MKGIPKTATVKLRELVKLLRERQHEIRADALMVYEYDYIIRHIVGLKEDNKQMCL